ncbi:ATPase components of ABC transporters with duplicated ATPase domains [Propionibacterium cyclohexanicum]|uniref:ATPase components of ABC transporters with duplicated ATPase domains n=1 Tax=Propionibacterium cyclohexanicum TaxID=64702 RepID=A0A1H9PLZ4_9ACTN|nr:ABC-F family ATP-binding cassette domain-containing protein [Propionibacterium cyclohexanicum]SER49198.1 ATPase components of ABC transporters with duplicated ATPase domains [Propionibacterium cyclohexanicum]
MIRATDLEVRVGARLLLNPVSFQVIGGDKVGVVGRNGAGKTTTMRILAGEGQPASGSVHHSGRIGYLPQDPRESDLMVTARQRIVSARGLDRIAAELRRSTEEIATTTGSRRDKAMTAYDRADAQFTAAGGYAAEAEAARIAANLSLPDRVLEQPLHELSGGQRRRVELARILFSNADTLLLDEPTNHLDADSIAWLREFIKTFPGGVMMISHATELLDETVNKVFHLDANRATLDVYSMGWKLYLEQRQADEKRRRRERLNAERKAAQLISQSDKLHAKATKATAAQNMARRAERLLAATQDQRSQDKVARIVFPEPAPCGRTPLSAHDLSKSYGSLEVFTGVDLAIDRGSRVVVLGLNGAGKTTLLRVLYGLEPSDTGEVVAGHGLKLGYFAQEHDMLDMSSSVLENMHAAAPQLNDTDARKVLGSFLFTGDDDHKPAGVLSGGEKTRLALATLVVSSANVLLLDEPTNNLDPASREQVLEAIRAYQGAIVLVTHDEGAVEALEPDRVLILPDGVEDLWDHDYTDLVALA